MCSSTDEAELSTDEAELFLSSYLGKQLHMIDGKKTKITTVLLVFFYFFINSSRTAAFLTGRVLPRSRTRVPLIPHPRGHEPRRPRPGGRMARRLRAPRRACVLSGVKSGIHLLCATCVR